MAGIKMCFGTSSGRINQLFHFGPLIAIFLILFITFSGLHCLVQWWPPNTLSGQIHLFIYLSWPFIIFYNYFNAIFLGPGFVPLNWRPENPEDEKKLQFCKTCNSFKAPRSHHCRKCKRCVLKMDHHCPWINTCCGHKNHSAFVYFLFYAPLGCIHATAVLGPSIYRAIFRNYYLFYDVKDVPLVYLSVTGLILCMFAIGMAIGVTVALTVLLIIQIRIILKNQTGIEDWIVKKANHRRENFNVEGKFIYPYDLGKKQNMRQVFNWDGNLRPIGNGIWWPIIEGCDQFTLTMEQLSQKEEKRVHSVKYITMKPYNGSICPIRMGIKTCCCVPCSEDPRMKIDVDDAILVTRWQRHWLYGELEKDENDEKYKSRKVTKGWFPKICVRVDKNQKFDEYELNNSKTEKIINKDEKEKIATDNKKSK